MTRTSPTVGADQVIAQLLSFKQNPSCLNLPDLDAVLHNPLYNSFPMVDKKAIPKFVAFTQSGLKVGDALQKISFKCPFQQNKILELINHLTHPTTAQLLHLAYQILAWIALKQTDQKEDDLLVLFHALNTIDFKTLTIYFVELFKNLLIVFTTNPRINASLPLLKLIIDIVVTHPNIDSSSFNAVVNALGKGLDTKGIDIQDIFIDMFIKLFEEDALIIQVPNFIPVLNRLSIQINQLNPKAISILCYSTKNSFSQEILPFFHSLPNNIVNKLMNMPNTLDPAKFNRSPIIAVYKTEDFHPQPLDQLVLPSEELVITETSIDSLFSRDFQLSLLLLLPSLEMINENCKNEFIKSIANISNTLTDTKYILDLNIMLLIIFPALKSAKVQDIAATMYNNIAFRPDNNIFTTIGLTTEQNCLRNAILTKLTPDVIREILKSSKDEPFLYAEHLARLYYLSPDFDREFFMHEETLSSLMTVLSELQKFQMPRIINKGNLARSMVFSIFFDLLHYTETAQYCFKSKAFNTSFIPLLFNPELTSILTETISNCFRSFGELSDEIIIFIHLIFKKCIEYKSGEKYRTIAKNIAHSIIRSISINNRIGESYNRIIDIILEYIQYEPTEEMLHHILSMLSFISRLLPTIEITSSRFNNLLNLINLIDKDEPSDTTLKHLQDSLFGTITLEMNKITEIKIPSIISIILVSFCKSERFSMIIKYFEDLCQYTFTNVASCHEGDLDLILLLSLKGMVEYKKRKISFTIPQELIPNIYSLVATIVSIKSSYAVNKAFFSLFLPNKDGVFPPNSNKSIDTMSSLLSRLHNEPSPIYQIGHTKPLLEIRNVEGRNFNRAFAFAFYIRVDYNRTIKTSNSFVILEAKDNHNHKMQLVFTLNRLFLTYEGESKEKTELALIKDFPVSMEWEICIVIFAKLEETYKAAAQILGKMGEMTPFVEMPFDDNVDFEFCKTTEFPIPNSDIPPVEIGEFALIGAPFKTDQLSNLSIQGFSALDVFPKIIVQSTNPKININKNLMRKRASIAKLLPEQMVVRDFYPIFENIKSAPKHFAKFGLSLLNLSVKFSQKKNQVIFKTDFNDEIDSKILVDYTGIEFGQYEMRPKSIVQIPIDLGEFTGIMYLLTTRFRENLDYQMFSAFCQIFETIPDESGISREIFENVITNIWIWSGMSSKELLRSMRKLANSASDYSLHHKDSSFIFSSLVSQFHVLINSCRRDYSYLDQVRFRVLNNFTELNLVENDVKFIISLILSSRKPEEAKSYLLLLTTIAEKHHDGNLFANDHHMILMSYNTEKYFEIILNLILEIGGESIRKSITRLCFNLFAKNKPNLNIPNADVMCIQALYIEKAIEGYVPKSSGAFWYFWPMIYFLHFKIPYAEYFIENISSTKDFYDIMNLFDLIEAMNIFDVNDLKFRFLSLFLDQTPCPYHTELVMSRIFISLFFKYSVLTYSPQLLDLFEAQGVKVDNFRFENEIVDFKIADINKYFSNKRTGVSLVYKIVNHELRDQVLAKLPQKPMMSSVSDYFKDKKKNSLATFDHIMTKLLPTLNKDIVQLQDSIINILSEPKIDLDRTYIINLEINREKYRFLHMFKYAEEKIIARGPSSNVFTTQPRYISNPLIPLIHDNPKQYVGVVPKTPAELSKQVKQQVQEIKCKMITRDQTYTASLDFHTTKVYIKRAGFASVSIHYKDMPYIDIIKPCKIEIYLECCFSYLFMFDLTEYKQVCEVIKKLKLPVLQNQKKASKDLIQLWKDRNISTFDIVIAHNLLYCKSLNDIHNYPYMPMAGGRYASHISEERFSNEIQQYFSSWNAKFTECVPPERYLVYTSVDTYQSRCSLESSFNQEVIVQFLNVNFATQMQKDMTIPKYKTTELQEITLPQVTKIKYGIMVKDMIYIIAEDSAIFVLQVIKFPSDIKVVKKIDKSTLNGKFTTIYSQNMLISFDDSNGTVLKLNQKHQLLATFTSSVITGLYQFGHTIIYIIDNSVVMKSTPENFPDESRELFVETDQIQNIHISPKYNAIVYSTAFGAIKIRSGLNGKVLGSFTLSGKEIKKIFLTDILGLILVECDDGLNYYSLRFNLLGKYDFSSKIIFSDCFSAVGHDFYVYLGEDKVLTCFEPLKQDKVITFGQITKPILNFSYYPEEKLIVVMCKDNSVFIRTFPAD